MKRSDLRLFLNNQFLNLAHRHRGMDKGDGLLEFPGDATPGIVTGVGHKKVRSRRREIPLIDHGEINDLMTLLKQEIALLKKHGFRAAIEVEEFIGEEDFHCLELFV